MGKKGTHTKTKTHAATTQASMDKGVKYKDVAAVAPPRTMTVTNGSTTKPSLKEAILVPMFGLLS